MDIIPETQDHDIASQGDLDCINEALDLDNLISISQMGPHSEKDEIKDPQEKAFMEDINMFRKEYRNEFNLFRKKNAKARDNEFTLSYHFLRDLATFVTDKSFMWHVSSFFYIHYRLTKTALPLSSHSL